MANVMNNKLVFKYNCKTADQNFSKFGNALAFIDKIRNDKTSLNEAIDEQAELRLDMRETKRVQKSIC